MFLLSFPALLLQDNVFDLILHTGVFAKVILLSLAILSVMSWAITLNKYWQFNKFSSDLRQLLNNLRPHIDISSLYNNIIKKRNNPVGKIFEEGYFALKSHVEQLNAEFKKNQSEKTQLDINTKSEVLEKTIQLRLQTSAETELTTLTSGMSLLATAVSVSPFLGLLGTVWGIMYTFLSIGQAGNAELSVVAPGIAEALITTIVGLAVAIPALMCNNFLAARVTKIEDELDRLNTELTIYFINIWQHEKAKFKNRIGNQRNIAR